MIEKNNPVYPKCLLNIHRPPELLYIQGSFTDWSRPSVAIVGTRAATAGGRRMAEEVAYELAHRGVVIISGLARGIDRAAHEGALQAGGVTIAVIGTGLDINYPREHKELRQKITINGAIVSEFPAGTPPKSYHFPRRNRILAGLSDLILIVEAELRSGALNTAQWALEQGKEVMAVPRNPWDPGSEGVNRLIRDGAVPVTEATDITEYLDGLDLVLNSDLSSVNSTLGKRDERSCTQKIIESIRQNGSAGLDQIHQYITELSPHELNIVLSRMELEGRIRRGDQGYECMRVKESIVSGS